MKRNNELVNLEQLKIIRDEALKTNDDISAAEKVVQDSTLKLLSIRDNCDHELMVRYKYNQAGRIVQCLCCTKTVRGLMAGLDCYFKNIIDIPDTLQEENISEFALKLFEQERIKHPELSDAEIVAIINEQIKCQTPSVEESTFVKSMGTKNQQQ